MKKWLFNLLAAASFVLCATTLIFAVRSRWRSDNWERASYYSGDETLDIIECSGGRIEFTRLYAGRPGLLPAVTVGWSHHSYPTNSPRPFGREWRGGWGVHWQPLSLVPFGGGIKYRVWNVSLWPLAGILAVLPLIRSWSLARAFRARRNRLAGKCENCGYDLRGTPQRCPECGTIPGESPAKLIAMKLQ